MSVLDEVPAVLHDVRRTIAENETCIAKHRRRISQPSRNCCLGLWLSLCTGQRMRKGSPDSYLVLMFMIQSGRTELHRPACSGPALSCTPSRVLWVRGFEGGY